MKPHFYEDRDEPGMFHIWTESCEDFSMKCFIDGRMVIIFDHWDEDTGEYLEEVRHFIHIGQALVGMSDAPGHRKALLQWFHFVTMQIPITFDHLH